jgi:ribonuclease HI
MSKNLAFYSGNNKPMPKQRYYVVWKGRQTGILSSWNECLAAVSGYPEAEYKAFDSLSAAEAAFNGAYVEYKGKPATDGLWRLARVKPVLPSICVDAACDGAPGKLEYRGVETDSGRQVLHMGPYADGTNNVGEFLAIVHALAWMKGRERIWPVYSDSENAIAWVAAKKCRTRLEHTRKNVALFNLIERAESWLAENEYPNEVLKWDTEKWGEIPADFGRK